MTKVNDGTIRIRAAEWPAFLYDQKTEYDPENEEKGLLKGYVLVRVCCSLCSISVCLHCERHSGIYSQVHHQLFMVAAMQQSDRRLNCMV
jgi:hypothetical protein